ncbi:MAG: methyltransferase domain-containing protein [Candidatus Aenigmarchaeota archaeon]|nr:methyltransferase domain-containing protein [Candidatus Aenigmarchaeota archaeon]
MRIPELFRKLARGPQIITLKDAGMIAAFTGLTSGDMVVDAGAGSGFLSIFLANQVKPEGKVFSYELREDFSKIAARNVKKAGFEKYVEVKNRDIFKGIDEKDVDVITLDMPEPWHAIDHVCSALKKGGYLVSYLPTVEQMRKFVLLCIEKGLKHEQSIECIVREMAVKETGTRPETKGLMHTAYLSFFRK